MGSSLILAGLGMAAVGFAGRYAVRAMPQVPTQPAKCSERNPHQICLLDPNPTSAYGSGPESESGNWKKVRTVGFYC
jgi:hypothetical protein